MAVGTWRYSWNESREPDTFRNVCWPTIGIIPLQDALMERVEATAGEHKGNHPAGGWPFPYRSQRPASRPASGPRMGTKWGSSLVLGRTDARPAREARRAARKGSGTGARRGYDPSEGVASGPRPEGRSIGRSSGAPGRSLGRSRFGSEPASRERGGRRRGSAIDGARAARVSHLDRTLIRRGSDGARGVPRASDARQLHTNPGQHPPQPSLHARSALRGKSSRIDLLPFPEAGSAEEIGSILSDHGRIFIDQIAARITGDLTPMRYRCRILASLATASSPFQGGR